ncbi:MAG: hypothetical protein GY749_01290 [Desulfobacteraceae bacterium]|nr:hypothetical protein [Desulfobacteraceae bacterium]
MISKIQDTDLQISKNQMAKQQLSDYTMEADYYESKYGKSFPEFDKDFRTRKASYEMENDWMSWKFAVESCSYWITNMSE